MPYFVIFHFSHFPMFSIVPISLLLLLPLCSMFPISTRGEWGRGVDRADTATVTEVAQVAQRADALRIRQTRLARRSGRSNPSRGRGRHRPDGIPRRSDRQRDTQSGKQTEGRRYPTNKDVHLGRQVEKEPPTSQEDYIWCRIAVPMTSMGIATPSNI